MLANRNIAPSDIYHYLHTTDEDILNPLLLDNMLQGAQLLISHISQKHKIFMQVDSDTDGYTSAATLINYLNSIFPGFTQNYISYRLHDDKSHGLILETIPNDVHLVIAPDSSSNDYEVHKVLKERGIDVLVLDHHEADMVSEYACVINNQLCDYPNKTLSGVGVVYKFCSFLDSLLGINNAEQFADLVALGEIADMMLLTNFETKRIMDIGLNNIINPYFRGMTIKNEFSLKGNITPFGVAFYIAPYVNAVTRCGTDEEKMILFEAMLDHKAYELVPSTKRGFKGTFEPRVERACRECGNIKNRQAKARDISLETIKTMIEAEQLLDNKILIVRLPESLALERTLTGLVANKIANDYQRPTLILNETLDENGNKIWSGSGRNYNNCALRHLRKFIDESGYAIFAQGHEGAFGVAFTPENVQTFINYSNAQLADFDFTPKYRIDLIYNGSILKEDDVFSIANFDGLWGQGLEEPYILIENVDITNNNISLLNDKVLKIIISGYNTDITIIKFNSSSEEFERLHTDHGKVSLNIIGKFQKNIWNNNVYPQILIEDYEILSQQKYYF